MDLTFHPNQCPNMNKTINRIDKLRDSIKLSLKRLQYGQKLTKKQKQTIIKYLTNDFAYNLSKYVQKRAIKFQSEVGLEGCGWNILHFASKCNAIQCIQFVLKQVYHQFPDQYEKFINTRTVQGYTPIMVAIINEANDALSILLRYGAVNVQAVDNKRMTAYELAINYKNQQAIKVLMNYDNQSKKHKLINKQALDQPVMFVKRQQTCCYRSFIALFDCLSFGLYSNLASEEVKTLSSSPRRSSLLNLDFMTDRVKIARQPTQEEGYDIVWKDVAQIITNLKYPLFDSYNPFDIAQKNVVIKNNLILFQCLSQHPWVIRKILQVDRTKPNNFNINLYINFQHRKFSINNEIPFLKDRQQPMFIENHNEMWPMLLQKGLAKAHGSYFDLEDVPPISLIQEMTGFPTFEIDIHNYENSQVFALLKDIHNKGYLYFLEGTQGSNLSNEGKKDCFNVLQFFDKNDKKLILVNCPFVDEAWKEKEKYQMHSLKLIKSHFNNHDQMCIWIQYDKIKQYFSKIVVSTILPNYQRQSFKVKAKNDIFFTFKIDKERQEKIVIQLINLDTKKSVNFVQIKAYINEGSKHVTFSKGINGQNFTEGVMSAQNTVGEYMCCLSIDKAGQSQLEEQNIAQSLIYSKIEKKSEKYMLILWSVDGIEPKYLDESLGPIEFLNCVQMNTMKCWNENEIYRVEIVSDYALIMTKDKGTSLKMFVTLQVNPNDMIQGKIATENTVQLVRYQDEDPFYHSFYYCIIRNASRYHLTKKSSYIKDKKEFGPAGQSSIGKRLSFFTQ